MKTVINHNEELDQLIDLYKCNRLLINVHNARNSEFIELHKSAKNNPDDLTKLKIKYFFLLNNICQTPYSDERLATLHNFSSKNDNNRFFNNDEYFYNTIKKYYTLATTVVTDTADTCIEAFNEHFDEDFKIFKSSENLKKNILNSKPEDINKYRPIAVCEARKISINDITGRDSQMYFMIVADEFKTTYYVDGEEAMEWFVKESEHFKVKKIQLLSGELVAHTSEDIIAIISTGMSNFAPFENTIAKENISAPLENNCDATKMTNHLFMEYIDYIVDQGFGKYLVNVLAHINYTLPAETFSLENDKTLYYQSVKGVGGVLLAYKILLESGGAFKRFLKDFSSDYESYSNHAFKNFYYADELTFQPNIISIPEILLNGEEFDASQLKFEYGVNIPLNYSSNHIIMDFVYWSMVKRTSPLLNNIILKDFKNYLYFTKTNPTVRDAALKYDVLRFVRLSQVILNFDESMPMQWQLELKSK